MQIKFGFPWINCGGHNRRFLFGVTSQQWNWFIYLGFVRIKVNKRPFRDDLYKTENNRPLSEKTDG